MSLVLVSLLLFSGAVQGCRNGFFPHGSSCYAIPSLSANWPDAKTYCKVFGADLARIETPEENAYLNNHLKRNYASLPTRALWLDGCDIIDEGEWMWAGTQGKIELSFWKSGQPDNARNNEHCLEVDAGASGSTNLWNDRGCGEQNGFVCEYTQADATLQPIG